MRLTDYNIEDLDIDPEAAFLFWTVVEAVRDYVFFSPTASRHRNRTYHRLARKWIMNPNYEVEWGDGEDAPRFTFGEALEMLGVYPENVDIFRGLIRDARRAKTEEDRKKLIKQAYSELHFHDNEPDPYGSERRYFNEQVFSI